MPSTPPFAEGIITILRHGESLHNVNHNYAFPDPPLTEKGFSDARQIRLPKTPDLIIISPMTRTVQTAIQAFEDLISGPNPTAKVQIWPDLREAHYKICNRGIARQELVAKFPDFDFSECHEQWDYPPHAIEGAVIRAREVREKLRKLATKHNHILLITHRAFIAFLVQGERFKTCETRSYRFVECDELDDKRYGINIETLERHDFGPNFLLPLEEGRG